MIRNGRKMGWPWPKVVSTPKKRFLRQKLGSSALGGSVSPRTNPRGCLREECLKFSPISKTADSVGGVYSPGFYPGLQTRGLLVSQIANRKSKMELLPSVYPTQAWLVFSSPVHMLNYSNALRIRRWPPEIYPSPWDGPWGRLWLDNSKLTFHVQNPLDISG